MTTEMPEYACSVEAFKHVKTEKVSVEGNVSSQKVNWSGVMSKTNVDVSLLTAASAATADHPLTDSMTHPERHARKYRYLLK